jgi:hypothetical protein
MKLILKTISLAIIVIGGFFCFVNTSHAFSWTSSGNDIYYSGGNVYVGDSSVLTQSKANFTVRGGSINEDYTAGNLINIGGGGGAKTNLDFYTFDSNTYTKPAVRLRALDNNYSANFEILTKEVGNGANGLVSRFFISATNGNVNIGATTTAYKLNVQGDLNFTGNLYKNGVLFTSSSTSASTTVNSSPWLNEIGTIEIRGTIGHDAVDLIVHVTFLYYLLIFSLIFISFLIIFRKKNEA